MAAAIDGEVLMRAVNPGIEVQGQYAGGTAAELFTVGTVDRVWVLADIYEADVGRVKMNAPASVRVVSYKDKLFEGTVHRVQHVLDPQTRTAKARSAFDNPGGELLPETFGAVSIQVVRGGQPPFHGAQSSAWVTNTWCSLRQERRPTVSFGLSDARRGGRLRCQQVAPREARP